MSKEEKKDVQENVEFLTSLVLAVPVDDQVKHVQLVLCRVSGTDQLRCFMDVVDPSKVKLQAEKE